MTDPAPSIPLYSELLDALRRKGMTGREVERIISAAITYLQQTYAGDELYIPWPARVIPVADIRSALGSGMSVRAICRRWHIASKTFYRLLDDG